MTVLLVYSPNILLSSLSTIYQKSLKDHEAKFWDLKPECCKNFGETIKYSGSSLH